MRVTWASPCASVGVLSAETDPPPSALHATGTLGTGLSLASVTRTTSGLVRSAPAAALCPFPLTISIVVGASAVAVPVNTTGGSPENTALTVCGPTAAGMVHRVLARPLGSVWTLTGLTDPEPAGTTQVMGRPPIPLPFGSSRRTTRSRATSNPAGALWPSPDTSTSAVGLAGAAVWLNSTGEPVKPSTVACADCAPAVGPSTRSAAASPSAPVSTVTGEIEPPPLTLHVTSTLATGFPSASVAFTTSESASAEFTGPVWSSPLTPASTLPLPATAVAVNETSSGPPSPPLIVRAFSSWAPAVPPRVQVALARPFASVVTASGSTEPPPLAMTKVTSWSGTG